MLELTLPFPPSVNHYWRHVGPRTLISREGRAFRASVCAYLKAIRVTPFSGPLAVHIDVHPPDRRRRDLDNLQKAPLDALQHGGAYHDDSQIVWLSIDKRDPVPGGKCRVWIFEESGHEAAVQTARARVLCWLWTRYDAASAQRGCRVLSALPAAWRNSTAA